MKSRLGWVLTRHRATGRVVGEFKGEDETLAVIIPSKRVTNKAVDDIVREFHLREYGRLWPTKAVWRAPSDPLKLTLKTPVCMYVLTRVDVYG